MQHPEYLALIISIIASSVTFVGSMIALFLWNRSESREDRRTFEIKLESNRKETNDILKSIQEEIKDFHIRLCKIEEEKYKIILKNK